MPPPRERVRLQASGPTAALPAPWPRRLCGAEPSGAERSAHCSLALRKATLVAGRRDAGLTHARARVNARLWGRERGSDGRRKRRGWAASGRRRGVGGAAREKPPEAPDQGTQILKQHYQDLPLERNGGPHGQGPPERWASLPSSFQVRILNSAKVVIPPPWPPPPPLPLFALFSLSHSTVVPSCHSARSLPAVRLLNTSPNY